MLASEIDILCDETARSTGLPVDWVLHHVNALAGKPCTRCGGSGIVLPGACFRCHGTGGRASHVSVGNALTWVRANVEKVRSLGERRAAKAPDIAAAHRRTIILAAETWKRDNPDLWEFLEDMLDNEFKLSLIRAVESGRVTPNQEDALRQMVAAKKRRSAVAPLVGAQVSVRGMITYARHHADLRGQRVFRVEFDSEFGWRGRVDILNPKGIDRIQARHQDDVLVRGLVVWRKDGFAVLSEQSEILLGG